MDEVTSVRKASRYLTWPVLRVLRRLYARIVGAPLAAIVVARYGGPQESPFPLKAGEPCPPTVRAYPWPRSRFAGPFGYVRVMSVRQALAYRRFYRAHA